MQTLSLVMSECFLSGRGQGHVSNFLTCGLRKFRHSKSSVYRWYTQIADLHMAQQMLLPLTVPCFSKIQIGFIFLVPAHPGSPGQRANKWLCVCVGLIPTYYATMQIIPLHIHGSKEVCTPYTYPVMLELLTNSYSSLGTTLCYQLQLKKSVGRYTQTTMSSTGTIYCLTILNCTWQSTLMCRIQSAVKIWWTAKEVDKR